MQRSAQPTTNSIIDAPPFCLEQEIRFSEVWSGFWALAAGLGVLAALQLLKPWPAGPLPSLALLLTVSIGCGACYLGVRFVSYWTARIVVMSSYPPVGRVHPAASGELPRTAFLCMLLAPGIVCALGCAVAAKVAAAFGPEYCLAIAVVTGVTLRDLRAAYRVLLLPGSRWIRERRSGLEVLRLVDAT